MKILVYVLFTFFCLTAFGQVEKERFPSYFGIQVKPVFPTRFIGNPTLSLSENGFETTLSQRIGYSFGGTVRAGLTKLIALETGINFTQRNFDLTMGVPDSNSYAEDNLSFIEYDIPVNALFYIQLSKKFYMNASLGAAITFKPTDVGVLNQPGGYHLYTHTGLTRKKVGLDLNANVGFEFRTEKSGFFYLGGSARVPFAPLFDLVADWSYQGNNMRMVGEVDGSFLAIDFKYFFPQIKNKGPQFLQGPIE
jgi:hypothetical protein